MDGWMDVLGDVYIIHTATFLKVGLFLAS